KGLLYAAAQHGMYISYDDGDHWESMSLNLPDVPIADIEVEDHDIAIASHGRGFYVLDNIEPLRQYTPAMEAEKDVVLFAPAPRRPCSTGSSIRSTPFASIFSMRRASSCAACPTPPMPAVVAVVAAA